MFLPHEAEIILGLPLSNSLPDDKLIWNPSSNGIFSIRSAYKLTMEVRDQPRDGSCSNDSDIKCFWRRIWRLHIPNKVKHFAWIACKNILPTLSNLKRRGIIEDDTCEACGTDTESTGHVF